MAVPSTDHILKMESSKSIDCTILKSLKVPEPGLGVIFSVITPGSITKKECYEVTISTFLVWHLQRFSVHVQFRFGKSFQEVDSVQASLLCFADVDALHTQRRFHTLSWLDFE